MYAFSDATICISMHKTSVARHHRLPAPLSKRFKNAYNVPLISGALCNKLEIFKAYNKKENVNCETHMSILMDSRKQLVFEVIYNLIRFNLG